MVSTIRKYREMQYTDDHRSACGKHLHLTEGELRCDELTIERLRATLAAAPQPVKAEQDERERYEALRDRLVTIVDEACGLQPVDTSDDDLLTLIEKDNSQWRARSLKLEKRREHLEQGCAEAFVNLQWRRRMGEELATHQTEWIRAHERYLSERARLSAAIEPSTDADSQ